MIPGDGLGERPFRPVWDPEAGGRAQIVLQLLCLSMDNPLVVNQLWSELVAEVAA